jgi:hypothetical protein
MAQCGEVVVMGGLHLHVVQKKYKNLKKKAHTVACLEPAAPPVASSSPATPSHYLSRAPTFVVMAACCVVDVGGVAVVVVMVLVMVKVVVLNVEPCTCEH